MTSQLTDIIKWHIYPQHLIEIDTYEIVFDILYIDVILVLLDNMNFCTTVKKRHGVATWPQRHVQ